MLFSHDSNIAGANGDIYANNWHQQTVFDRIVKTVTFPAMLELMKSWNIQYFIARKPAVGERLWAKELSRIIGCTVREYERGDTYLARLDPACKPAAESAPLQFPSAEPALIARTGFYDDFDPIIVFRGDWTRDEGFSDPLLHTVSYTDTAGSEVAFAFNGKGVTWVYTRAPNRGIAEVTIGGVRKNPVDLYSPGIEWHSQSRYCCFPIGKHLMVIRVAGRRHGKVTRQFVDVGGFVVE